MSRLCTRSWSRKLLASMYQVLVRKTTWMSFTKTICRAHSMWTSGRRKLSGICSWIILFEVQVLSMLRTILSAMVVGIGGDYSYAR